MHVVGAPFIKGPSLKVVFRTEHGQIIDIKYAEGKLERFSDSVLFFKVPPYPNSQAILLSNGLPPGTKRNNNTPTFIDPSGSNGSSDMLTLTAYVSVTNDSRHFSNQLKFTYYFKT